jgi:hypothetical protein
MGLSHGLICIYTVKSSFWVLLPSPVLSRSSFLEPEIDEHVQFKRPPENAMLLLQAAGWTTEPVDVSVSAAEINVATFAASFAASPPLFQESFRRLGAPLRFLPDKDITSIIETPIDWMKAPLVIEPDSDGGTTLCCPCISTPPAVQPFFDRGPGRFVGNHYIKCPSPAWFHEWVMIEGLRPRGVGNAA